MRFVVTGLFLLLSASVFAQLEIDQPILHNMVLQRGKPLILSGKALPSNTVKIHIECLNFPKVLNYTKKFISN